MKKILLIFTVIILSCASQKELPKSPIVRETERTIKKAELALVSGEFSNTELINNSLSLSIATNIPNLKIRALLLKANLEIKNGEISKAIKSIEKAKDIAQKEDLKMMPYVNYYELVILYLSKDYENLEKNLNQSVNYPDEIKASIKNLKTLVMIKNKNFETALEEAESALDFSKKNNNLIEQSFSLKLIAFINYHKEDYEKSIDAINLSLSIDRSLYFIDYLFWDLEMLGKIYILKNEKEKALYYYQNAYELALANKNEKKASYFKEKISELLQ